nr:Mariner Mos1 transposase [Hymenolepis microstoma]
MDPVKLLCQRLSRISMAQKSCFAFGRGRGRGDQLGVIYYEPFEPSETITGERYGTQLMRHLSRAQEKEKRPQYNERHDKVVILQHDNARPHEMDQSGEKYPERCCSVSFSPHSPRSIAPGLADQHFRSYEEVKNWTHRLMDLIER